MLSLLTVNEVKWKLNTCRFTYYVKCSQPHPCISNPETHLRASNREGVARLAFFFILVLHIDLCDCDSASSCLCRCVCCVQCGSTSPGFHCEWQNNYTHCGPCASLVTCPVCKENFMEEELLLQCQYCDRWVLLVRTTHAHPRLRKLKHS